MKKIIIGLLLILMIPVTAFAQTPTPSKVTPTITTDQQSESLINQINELKDKVASRVAQLKLVEKKGVIGTVQEVTDTHITLTDINGNNQIVDVDELTKFSSTGKSTFGISDLTKGSTISALGLYNKESKDILARFIDDFKLPVFLSGTVSDVNKTDYTVTVAGEDNISTIVDIETTTKINAYSGGKIGRSGFSKVVSGDRVEIVGYPNKTEKNRITGSYILQLNDLSTASVSPTATK